MKANEPATWSSLPVAYILPSEDVLIAFLWLSSTIPCVQYSQDVLEMLLNSACTFELPFKAEYQPSPICLPAQWRRIAA